MDTETGEVLGALRRTTVGELDWSLPIGFEVNGERHRQLAFKPWTARDERELGAIRSKRRNIGTGEFLSEVLAHFLVTFGPHDFTSMSRGKRLMVVSQAWAADVYHAWIMLRRDNIDDEYAMEIRCPTCETQFTFTVRLDEIESMTADEDTILRKPCKLRHGIKYRDEIRKLATIEPLRWMTFEKLHEARGNVGDVKLRVIEGGLVGLDGVDGDLSLPRVLLDDLSKRDVETLVHAMTEDQPGPDLGLSITCPSCRTLHQERVEWAYDPFFSVTGSTG